MEVGRRMRAIGLVIYMHTISIYANEAVGSDASPPNLGVSFPYVVLSSTRSCAYRNSRSESEGAQETKTVEFTPHTLLVRLPNRRLVSNSWRMQSIGCTARID